MDKCSTNKKLRTLFARGWFSLFQRAIEKAYGLFPGCWINSYFRSPVTNESPPGASEFYILLRLLIGVLWLIFINEPLKPFLYSDPAVAIGFGLALYFMTEVMVFTLKWIFVDYKKLESIKRSLICFLLNVVEIAFLSSIAFTLLNCATGSPCSTVYSSFRCIFSFELFKVSTCRYVDVGSFLAHYQLIVAWLLLLVVIAGLAGSAVREEKGKH